MRTRKARCDAQSAEFIVTSGKFHVVDAATGCWNWARSKNIYGYGQVCCMGRKRIAHRVFYEFCKGPIGDGLQLDHLCRNRACVNPSHLEAVTPRVNVLRSALCTKTACRHGHPYDAHGYITPNGELRCRACRKLAWQRLKLATGAGDAPAKRTHCPRGHEYAGANLAISRGKRRCRACNREKTMERKSRLRAVLAGDVA